MRNFILGTDWWSDCDDAVAVRLLVRAAKERKIRLLGIGINACMKDSVASMRGFLRTEGMEEMALGLDREAVDFPGKLSYQMRLASEYCPEGTNEEAEDALRLYRRLLAEAAEPVEIIEIGFLQVAAALLLSEGDDISEKSGLELVREKVKKFWVMAGKWDRDGESEHNFCLNERSRRGAEIFCRLCPVEVTFLGWEIGINVLTGEKLAEGDVLHQVLADHGSAAGRHSWDPMLVLLALTGDEEAAGYEAVRGWARVDAQTGQNYFMREACGLHRYVKKKQPDDFYRDRINERIRSENNHMK